MTMRVSLRRSARPATALRRVSGRAGRRPHAPAAAPEPPVAPGPDELRARASGGPEDKALYTCSCGCTFHAPVSASVSCPRCGGTQAW
jgi:hypothetical protein